MELILYDVSWTVYSAYRATPLQLASLKWMNQIAITEKLKQSKLLLYRPIWYEQFYIFGDMHIPFLVKPKQETERTSSPKEKILRIATLTITWSLKSETSKFFKVRKIEVHCITLIIQIKLTFMLLRCSVYSNHSRFKFISGGKKFALTLSK